MKKILYIISLILLIIPFKVKAAGYVMIYNICQTNVGCKEYGMDAEQYNNGLYNQTDNFYLKYSTTNSATPNSKYELGISPNFMHWNIIPGQKYNVSFNVKTRGQENNFYNWLNITGVRQSSKVDYFEVEKKAISSTEVNYKISIIFSSVPSGDINFYLESNQSAIYLDWFDQFISYFTRPIVSNVESFSTEIQQGFDNLNANIDSMKDKQDQTNDLIGSDSENTEDKSCGIICKLKGIFTGIIELPGKLVSLLIDALKNLFVPTDEQLYEIINDSKDLAENFGFIGETINFFISIFTSLLGMVNANGCIELPEFTIGATSLTPSITFWQAQNVCLNDNVILARNITTIRTITSIVLVGLFINFASRKFFSIMSKTESQNDQAQEILDRYK